MFAASYGRQTIAQGHNFQSQSHQPSLSLPLPPSFPVSSKALTQIVNLVWVLSREFIRIYGGKGIQRLAAAAALAAEGGRGEGRGRGGEASMRGRALGGTEEGEEKATPPGRKHCGSCCEFCCCCCLPLLWWWWGVGCGCESGWDDGHGGTNGRMTLEGDTKTGRGASTQASGLSCGL